MASNIASLLGWTFLPNIVTGYAQTIFYSVTIRAGDPKPPPGSKRWVRDRRRIQIAVILFYLIYTIFDADYQLRQAGDFYRALGMPYDASEKAIQSRFRRLTVQYHPDKATGADKSTIEAIYVQLQLARDTLVDPAKRFAYDRFGPEILQWRQCKSIRDFVLSGIQRTTAYYIITTAVLVLISTLGYAQSGKFWRYLTIAGLFATEMYIITLPDHPAILTHTINPLLLASRLRNPYLPFQFISLLRKLALTFFIALSQLGPLMHDPHAPSNSDVVSTQQLDGLGALTRLVEMESARLTGLELMPFASEGPSSSMATLRATLKEWMVQNTIRNDREVNVAITEVLERRRGVQNAG